MPRGDPPAIKKGAEGLLDIIGKKESVNPRKNLIIFGSRKKHEEYKGRDLRLFGQWEIIEKRMLLCLPTTNCAEKKKTRMLPLLKLSDGSKIEIAMSKRQKTEILATNK